MKIGTSNLNESLSGSIFKRIAADQFLIAGRAGFWRLIGLGSLALGAGIAVGIAFWGYSWVTKNQDNITNMSAMISKALRDAELHGATSGTVQVTPSEITLAPGQTVALDQNATIQLEPDAKINANGTLLVQAPTISAPRSTANGSPKPTVTNFVVFKTVPYGKGTVSTGWRFLTSAQKTPTRQYCYYTEKADAPQLQVDLYIAFDGVPTKTKQVLNTVDLADAQTKCVWWK